MIAIAEDSKRVCIVSTGNGQLAAALAKAGYEVIEDVPIQQRLNVDIKQVASVKNSKPNNQYWNLTRSKKRKRKW
jgi:hypothetical protein